MDPAQLAQFIDQFIRREVVESDTTTRYREPLVAFASALDPGFGELRRVVDPSHLLPEELLPGARSVISFFVPFEANVVLANAQEPDCTAHEWAVAYVETNDLINGITARVIEQLARRGVRGETVPATHNFDPDTLVSRWSHKSVAVLTGLGSFGLHHLIITDAGCAGRFGSLVIDVALPHVPREQRERCLYYHDGSCLECVTSCPIGALHEDRVIDKTRCWHRVKDIAAQYAHLGIAQVCGKCSLGPCALAAAVN